MDNIDNKLKALWKSFLYVFLPYSAFCLSIFFLAVVHSGLFSNYKASFYWAFLSVFIMVIILIGTSFLFPMRYVILSVRYFSLQGKNYEMIKHSDGSLQISKKGYTGAGLIILRFIANLLIAPIGLVLWFVISILIFSKKGFANYYLEHSENISTAKISALIALSVAFMLSLLEIGIINGIVEKYSPNKITMETGSLVLESTGYDTTEKTLLNNYTFTVFVTHPQLNELSDVKCEITFEYNGISLEKDIINIGERPFDKDKKSFVCYVKNTIQYLDDPNRECLALSNIDLSKIIVHVSIKEVYFGKHEFNYIYTSFASKSLREMNADNKLKGNATI